MQALAAIDEAIVVELRESSETDVKLCCWLAKGGGFRSECFTPLKLN